MQILLEVKLSYEPVSPSVGLVVDWSVCRNFLNPKRGWKFQFNAPMEAIEAPYIIYVCMILFI